MGISAIFLLILCPLVFVSLNILFNMFIVPVIVILIVLSLMLTFSEEISTIIEEHPWDGLVRLGFFAVAVYLVIVLLSVPVWGIQMPFWQNTCKNVIGDGLLGGMLRGSLAPSTCGLVESCPPLASGKCCK